MAHCRNRTVRRGADKCATLGHDWSETVETYNDPFHGSPYLPGGVVGWSKHCKRCGAVTGRGEY